MRRRALTLLTNPPPPPTPACPSPLPLGCVMQYMATMGTPNGGRHGIPARLQRLFFVLAMAQPSDAAVMDLFGSMLMARYARATFVFLRTPSPPLSLTHHLCAAHVVSCITHHSPRWCRGGLVVFRPDSPSQGWPPRDCGALQRGAHSLAAHCVLSAVASPPTPHRPRGARARTCAGWVYPPRTRGRCPAPCWPSC